MFARAERSGPEARFDAVNDRVGSVGPTDGRTAMTAPTAPEDILREVASGGAPILETLAEMHLDTFERSGLDARTYFLVRLAALVAMEGAPASYIMALATAEESGATLDDIRGTLAAVAPIVGSARVVSAASNALRGLGIAEMTAERETEGRG